MKKTILIVLGVLLGVLTTFAVLTKTGVIDNFLGIPLLCPNQSEVPGTVLPNDSNNTGESSNTTEEVHEIVLPDDPNFYIVHKPVIYLYPIKIQEVSVNLAYPGDLLITYPKYENGWSVIANPDGTIINNKDSKEYSYLFWEGKEKTETKYDMTSGFVVKGIDTIEFLQEKLFEIGLTPKEYNEFIVYWAPQMIKNEYNLIHFATDSEYANRVKLNITPAPDSVLRVFMVYKSIDKYIEVRPQVFPSFERNGFTVVEWGGSQIN